MSRYMFTLTDPSPDDVHVTIVGPAFTGEYTITLDDQVLIRSNKVPLLDKLIDGLTAARVAILAGEHPVSAWAAS